MLKLKALAKKLVCIAFSSCAFLGSARAEPILGRFMPTVGIATAPDGHIEFCRIHPLQCNYQTKTPLVVRLSPERWQELQNVNSIINQSVQPMTDQQQFGVAEYWTYPQGAGDCEEYVLEKQRQLIARGWPPSALLITVVKDLENQGHAVLSVRTDKGDLILDNQVNIIMPWYSSPYRYVKRQSARHSAAWAAISDKRVTTVASIPN